MSKYLVIVVLLVGCGGGDKCEKAFDKMAAMDKGKGKLGDKAKAVEKCKAELKDHPDQEKMLDCIVAVKGDLTTADLSKCAQLDSKDFDDYKNRSKATEAKLQLNKLGKNAKRIVVETGAFPKGKVGPSPAAECCGAAQDHKCPVDAKAWADPVWQAMEFSIDEPSLYRYSYESTDGKTFTATAIGDADCDSTMATYTLTGKLDASGNPSVDLTEPPKGTY
jgi:hypothetical protein